jgi:serine/threonine protein kinase/DNA-binding CsgD family transcriptional regulator
MIGQKLSNRYVIQELIGEGATAAVYKATDMRLGRLVAVKILLPHVHVTTRQRFEREARAAGMLNHPGIMQIYDVGQDGDKSYLVCELIEGRPLHDLIPASADVVADISQKICLALDYAHSKGLIHRDVKPANIYITNDNQIKVMDMGLAMPIDARDKRLTATGSIIGTPAYLSPEQAQGKRLDPRTDLYSLAIVMYELLTGQLPFDADDIASILIQQVNKAPIPPSQLVAGIPDWLEAAILRALEKNPERRFASAAEMADALIEPQPIAPVADVVHSATPEKLSTRPSAMINDNRIRAVVVDDHVILRTTLATFLSDTGEVNVVGEGGNGLEAIELVKSLRPDVLLLDLNMPKMPGLVALPIIKKENSATKVIVLTGRDETTYIMQALRSGANGYMLKTASEQELLQAVRDVAGGNIVLGQGVAERIVQGLQMMNETDPLTEEERDVLRCIAAGLEENSDIAQKLGWDEEQTTRIVMETLDKLGVPSRNEAALKALRAGWISVDDMRATQH